MRGPSGLRTPNLLFFRGGTRVSKGQLACGGWYDCCVLGRVFGLIVGSLVALIVVGALTACGGGGKSKNETAAQLYAQEIRMGQFETYAPGTDQDVLDRSSTDVTTTIRPLGHDHYVLYIQNTSDVGFINTLRWRANGTAGLGGNTSAARLIKVVNSSSGDCGLSDPNTISCTGLTIHPPKCTCRPGGTLSVEFIAKPTVKEPPGVTLAIMQNSRTILGNMTPVPYHIPSYIGQATNADLPLCTTGQQSTKSRPCVHAN